MHMKLTGLRSVIISIVVVAAALACAGLGVSSSLAFVPYGEVRRFGGYNATGVTGSEEGKLLAPVGFAVEPGGESGEEDNVYVLDRTRLTDEEATGKGEIEYRLDEYAGTTGTLRAHTSFTIDYKEAEKYEDAHPLIGLAVDPKSKRVYSVVESLPNVSSAFKHVPVVGWVVAWSTETLKAPADLPASSIVAGAGVVAELAGGIAKNPSGEGLELEHPIGEDLYLPQAIAVDPSSGDLVIEAQHGIASGKAGPVELAKVETTDPAASDPVVEEWKGEASNIVPKGENGAGLFPASGGDGGFGIGLWPGNLGGYGQIEPLGTVEENLSTAHGSLLDEEEVEHEVREEGDASKAPMLESTTSLVPNGVKTETRGATRALLAGSPMAQLEVGAGAPALYAAMYAQDYSGPVNDSETSVPAWEALGLRGEFPLNAFWMVGGEEDENWGNVGVRLFESENGKTTILDTIGGGDPKVAPWEGPAKLEGSCSIDDSRVALMAGAKGSVFVLTEPEDREGGLGQSHVVGGEIIEFAPEGTYPGMHPCPTATGEVEVDGAEAASEEGGTATATAYAKESTRFDAISLDRRVGWAPPVDLASTKVGFSWKTVEWQPFAFEWDFDTKTEGYTAREEIKESPSGSGEYRWPSPEATHTYAEPGTYEAQVRVYGDYGTKVFPFDVKVLATEKPTASFSCEVEAGLTVSCDASASTATRGAEIDRYEWSWQAGEKAQNVATPKVHHTYAAPGTYEVTLVVHDHEGTEPTSAPDVQSVTALAHTKAEEEAAASQNAEAEAAKRKAEAEAAARHTAEEEAARRKTEEAASVKTPSQSKSPSVPSRAAKSETTAQKLARALKLCRRDKPKSKRARCEKQMRRRYSSKRPGRRASGKKAVRAVRMWEGPRLRPARTG